MRTFVFAALCLPLVVSRAATAQPATVPPQNIPPQGATLPPVPLAPLPDAGLTPTVDFAGAQWTPAAEGNFDHANRPQGQPIDTVVIHDIEGTPENALAIFSRVGAKVSAHYVVAGNGTIYQMVRERDIAWHAGNYAVNQRAIGVETEGYAYRPGFYNPLQYEAEASLVRDITTRYAIPRDRTHIIGHAEVPNPTDPTKFGGKNGHTDPGPYWDWNTFMTLVRSEAHVSNAQLPTTIHPGETLLAAITFANAGDDPWFANHAPNPLTGLQATGPALYLGTKTGKPSALFNAAWISPLYAAGLNGTDVAPGSNTRFAFTLQGPRTLGIYREDLRLWSVPTFAQGGTPIGFGDSVPLSLNVMPWELTASAPDASALPNPPARYTTALPVGGWWELSVKTVRLPRKKARSAFALISFAGAPPAMPHFAKIQAERGGEWQVLGRYAVPEPRLGGISSATVTLSTSLDGTKPEAAATVRWVGPFPDSVPTTVDK